MKIREEHGVPGRTRIVFLDYLRIFAFASVLAGPKFYDLSQQLMADDSLHATPKLVIQLLVPLNYGGGIGVVAFFLVSGYSITCIVQTESATEFSIKRIFRKYPFYVVAVLSDMLVTDKQTALSDLIPNSFSSATSLGHPISWAE